MATWDKESVERTIRDKGWYKSERPIQNAIQFTLVDGTRVNCYRTGRVQVQGRDTPIKEEAKRLFEDSSESPNRAPQEETAAVKASSSPKRVFIVYGHDLESRDQLELLLRRLRLEPIILQNIPGKGDTIIEKLEEHTDAAFACVLLTPDDEGRRRGDADSEIRPRARQNVVLELGMVLSRLGRRKVAILVKGDDIERPSDVDGLIYIQFSGSVDDVKTQLAANLQNAGFDIRVEDLTA